MSQPDYFKLLDLPERFALDAAELKRKYLRRSKEPHPDLAGDNPERQAQRLTENTLVNEAFKRLNKPWERLAYLLQRYGLLDDSLQRTEKQDLAPAFLLEMMAYNERASELASQPTDAPARQAFEQELQTREEAKWTQVATLMQGFDSTSSVDEKHATLKSALDLYLEHRYLLRIRHNLTKFADL